MENKKFKFWDINRIKNAQPYIIGMQLVISSVTLAKIVWFPQEVFTCGVNMYNPSQIICIKE